MKKSAILEFLQAIDDELTQHAAEGERLDLYLAGRAALVLRYDLPLATKDVDMVTRGEVSALQTKALEAFGKGKPAAQSWGLYLESLPEGFPPMPGRYRSLAVELPGNWKVLRPFQIDPNDLAISKLKRFHAGDREDLQILCDQGELSEDELQKSLDSAFPWGKDEDEDPTWKRVNSNYPKLVAYLRGQARSL